MDPNLNQQGTPPPVTDGNGIQDGAADKSAQIPPPPPSENAVTEKSGDDTNTEQKAD